MALAASILILVSRRFITHPCVDILMRQPGDEGHLLASMSSHFTPSVVAGETNVKYFGDNASLVATA